LDGNALGDDGMSDDILVSKSDYDAMVEALRSLVVRKVGDSFYIAAEIDGRGFWSAKCPDEMTPFIEHWARKRDAALLLTGVSAP
jgi:hypothetical protein